MTNLAPLLRKEAQAVFPFWGATVAALVLASLWRGRAFLDIGLFAYVVGATAIGAQAIGQEYSCRMLPMLLVQPTGRARLYVVKLSVAAVFLALLAVLAWFVFSDAWRPGSGHVRAVILPVLGALFLAPFFTMIGRGVLVGMILTGSAPAMLWLLVLVVSWFGFGMDPDHASEVLLGRSDVWLAVACPLLGYLGWRRFATLEAGDADAAAFRLPRWLDRDAAARRPARLAALVVKETHLHQLTFAVTGVCVVIYLVAVLLQRVSASVAAFPVGPVLVMYCLGVALVVGAMASAEERQLGMHDGQRLQPAPAWQQWTVKVAMAFGLAILLGVALPLLLVRLAVNGEVGFMRLWLDLAAVVVLLTAGSLYISSLSASGVRALAWTLPAGIAVALFVQTADAALRWVTLQVWGRAMADVMAGAVMPTSVGPEQRVMFALRVLVLTLVPVLVWFGFVNHQGSEPNLRRTIGQLAAIALVIATGMFVAGALVAAASGPP